MLKLFHTFKDNKQITTLFAANVLSQAIPVAFSPLLTRLYTPNDFGIYALFYSIINVFTVIISLRFENVFFIRKTFSKAKESLEVFVGVSFIIFVIIFLILFLLFFFLELENEVIIQIALFASFLNAFSIFLLNYTNRLGLYNLMGLYKIVKVVIMVSLQLLLGYFVFKYNGLVASLIVSSFIIVFYYSRKLKLKLNSVFRSINYDKIKDTFKRFKHFPQYSMPTSLIDNLNASLPIFILGYFYSEEIIGYYSLSFKVTYIPIILISISLSESIKNKISNLIRDGKSYRKLVFKWLKILLPISGIIFVLFYSLAEIGFPFIFGKNWAYSGSITKMLAIMFFFRILVNPFGFIFLVSEKQRLLFVIHVMTFVASLISLYLGFKLYNDPLVSILFYSLAYSIKYIIEAIFIFFISPEKLSK